MFGFDEMMGDVLLEYGFVVFVVEMKFVFVLLLINVFNIVFNMFEFEDFFVRD